MNDKILQMKNALDKYHSTQGGNSPAANPVPSPIQPVIPAPVDASAPISAPTGTTGPTEPDNGIGNALSQYRSARDSGTLPHEAPKPEGKVKNFFKGLVEAPATLVARPFEAAAVGAAQLFGGNDAADKTQGALDSFAKNQLGGFVAPIPNNAADVKKDVGRGGETVALGLGPVAGGALFGAGNSLEQGTDLFSAQTALQTVLGAAGGKVLDLVGKPLLDATGKVIGKVTPDVIKDVVAKGSGAIKNFAANHNIFPSGVSKVVNSTADKAESVLNKPFDLAKQMTQKSEKQLTEDIVSRFNKGVKPSVGGKNTASQVNRYEDNVVNGTRTIAENKANLSFTDTDGNVTTGRSPKTLQELSDAVDQTKKSVFSKYNNMAKEAGVTGAQVSTKPVVDNLDSVINNKALQATNPKAIEYAKAAKDRYSTMGNLDIDVAQDIISHYNESLKAFYRNPSYENASNASIDAMIANNLRSGLDDSISTFTGPGYSDFKKQYGALSAIEKDVVKASLRNAKSSVKGLLDFSDILSGGQLAHGILTMNPALIGSGLTEKGIAALYKHLNDPNRAIAAMFDSADKLSPRIFKGDAEKPAMLALPAKGQSSFKDPQATFYTTPSGKSSTIRQEAMDVAAVDTGAAKQPKQGRSNRIKLREMLENNEPYTAPQDLPVIKTGPKPKGNAEAKRLRDIYGDLPEISMDGKKKVNRKAGFSPIKTLAAGGALTGGAIGASKLKNMYIQPTTYQSTPVADIRMETSKPDATSTAPLISEAPKVIKTQTLPSGRTVHTLDSGTEVIDIHPNVEKALSATYKNNPEVDKGVLEALLMKESSAGYDDSNKNPSIGKYAWLGGLVGKTGAIGELDRKGIRYDLSTIGGALDAMAKYWTLLKDKKSNQGKTPDEIYDEGGYSSGKLKDSDIKKFKDFIQYYSTQ